MNWLRICVFLGWTMAAGSIAGAVQSDEMLSDPTLEARARALSQELRCLVCQNQSIDDSDAPLARDLRILLRDRLKAGDSDKEVMDFVVSRYGEFVLLRPPLAWHTALLWLAPVIVLAGGAAGLLLMLRRRGSRSRANVPLSVDEAARLSRLLDDSGS